MKQISETAKSRIVSLFNESLSSRDISRQLGISYYVVNKYRRICAPESFKPVAGRTRVLTERQGKVLVRNFKTGIYENIPDAKKHLKNDYNVDLTLTSVRNTLK
ncbi:uncharacterized protein VTP21DRAFT_5310 [Calcarisporiella thermophila]|uniref:uncharacterized protein n=1 Tax=Calcarisporiella thermophila TaxID=911321 RepID=UPI0037434AD2